jgi:hypothetical protein
MGIIEKARNYLSRRRRAYQLSFAGVNGEIVLHDMSKFCRANKSCFHPDARVEALMEGRREVWLRIMDHLKLSEDQLSAIYIGKEANE